MNLFDVTVSYNGLPGKTVRVLAILAADAIETVAEECKLIAPDSITAKRVAHGKGQVAAIASPVIDR